ncbi:MAG: tetratricopeptide repeat protein [Phycisphaeraceae bacterium]|nr:tetratricopeptide repeat protein [Phycisphaeraceae bacterium]
MASGCSAWSGTGRAQRDAEARERMEQARSFMDQGRMASALAAFQLALQRDPRLVPAHVGVGDIYSDAGEYAIALRSYQRAVELDSTAYYPQFKVGQMHHFLDQIPQAIRGYLRALAIDPSGFDANHHLAAAYLQTGRAGDALPFARRAVELDHYSVEAWSQLAEALRVSGRYEEAVEAYGSAAELETIDPWIRMGMARSLIEIRRYEEAIELLAAIDEEVGGVEVLERWGFALFQLRDYRQALDRFDTAILRVEAAGGEDPELHRLLNGRGVCLMTLYIEGERANRSLHRQAIEAWRQSLRLRPNQPRIISLLSAYERG